MNGFEALVLPVAQELLKNAAVSAVKFFRDRGKRDEEAKEEASEILVETRSNVESAVEGIIGSALSEGKREEFNKMVEDSVLNLPIAEGLAVVTIARYCELPVYRVEQTTEWLKDSTLSRTAMNHAWIENRFDQCLIRLGYAITKGQQVREGVVNLWSDIVARTPQQPSHRISVDINCSPEPNDYRVAAFLYDMETANILQEGDWLLLATHGLFNAHVKGIIGRAKARAKYRIGTIEAPQIKRMIESQERPGELYDVLRRSVGETPGSTS